MKHNQLKYYQITETMVLFTLQNAKEPHQIYDTQE